MTKTAFVNFFGANGTEWNIEIILDEVFGDKVKIETVKATLDQVKVYYATGEWPKNETVSHSLDELGDNIHTSIFTQLVTREVTDEIAACLAGECFRDEKAAELLMDAALEEAKKQDDPYNKKKWLPNVSHIDGEHAKFVATSKKLLKRMVAEYTENQNEEAKAKAIEQCEKVIKRFNLYSIQSFDYKLEDDAPVVNVEDGKVVVDL